jgi:hypothetical protein
MRLAVKKAIARGVKNKAAGISNERLPTAFMSGFYLIQISLIVCVSE